MKRPFLSRFARRLSAIAIVLGVAVTTVAATRTFSWPGTYDLVATGFPNGPRQAVLQITPHDSTYSVVALQGPPGAPLSVSVTGDTARILWNLETADPMYVELLGKGDSVNGRWSMAANSGAVSGKRR
ncbi:MAG: hypothetical protein ABJE10_14365 [bacterium]